MQVFISHAASDRALAEDLAASLRKAGIHVWNPNEAILPGDNWALAVGKALEESDVMIALFTRATNGSPTVERDVQYALTSGKYRGRVVPVLMDLVTFDAGADVPWVLLRMDPVYLTSPPDFSLVVKQVQKVSEAGTHASA